MSDRWVVRVEGKEYGPVDLDSLAEWKRDGRLVAMNEVRRESDGAWTTAATIPELFGPPPLPPPVGHPLQRRRQPAPEALRQRRPLAYLIEACERRRRIGGDERRARARQ